MGNGDGGSDALWVETVCNRRVKYWAIRLLRTAHFAHAFRCTHSFARSLTDEARTLDLRIENGWRDGDGGRGGNAHWVEWL